MYTAPPHVAEAKAKYEASKAKLDAARTECIADKRAYDAEVVNEQYDHWGVTAEQYAAAKAQARAEEKPLNVVLNEVRRAANRAAREAQTGRVAAVQMGVTAKR